MLVKANANPARKPSFIEMSMTCRKKKSDKSIISSDSNDTNVQKNKALRFCTTDECDPKLCISDKYDKYHNEATITPKYKMYRAMAMATRKVYKSS